MFYYRSLLIARSHRHRVLGMILQCGICGETLRSQLNDILPCNHVFHHSCVEDVLQYARYFAASGRAVVDCVMCGAPTLVSLLSTFVYLSDDRARPRPVPAAGAEHGAGDEDCDGSLKTWNIFAPRQDVRGGFTVLLALQKIPVCVPCLRSSSRLGGLGLHDRFSDPNSGTRSVFGR